MIRAWVREGGSLTIYGWDHWTDGAAVDRGGSQKRGGGEGASKEEAVGDSLSYSHRTSTAGASQVDKLCCTIFDPR